MKLFTNYSIKLKIKVIAFSAILIIISMLLSLILFSNYFENKTDDIQNNHVLLQSISKEFQEKLLNTNENISQKDITQYFTKIEKFSNENQNKTLYTKTLIDTFILLLFVLLILFMFFGYILDRTIINSLNSLKDGMKVFFDYILNKNKEINKIDIKYDDEIGDILKYINQNLFEVKTIIEHEREFNKTLEENIKDKSSKLTEKTNYLEQYQYMIDKAESVIQFDLFGIITDVNKHYCNLSKYSKEELVGQPIVNFINSSESSSGFSQEITNVIKEGIVYKGINSDFTKVGDIFTTKTVILPILSRANVIEFFFCVRTDITQLTELTNEIIATQKDVISTMGEIGESRSKETGLHVKRVAEYSKLLATKCGLSQKDSELLYNASPMHDIGKVGIADKILNKPGKLTPEEFEIMKTHTTLGFNMLKNSKRDILGAAAIIAHEHHERYDGSGYPNNKKADEIHIFGRITAIADIFDALGSDRCYKKSWDLEDIVKLLIEEKGKHFDPKLVDLFLDNIDEFIEIRDTLKDDVNYQI